MYPDARLNALLLAPAFAAPPAATAPEATVAPMASAAPTLAVAPAASAAITKPETALQPPAPAGIAQQDIRESSTNSVEASVAQQARILAQEFDAEREAARALDDRIASASDAVRAAVADDIARRDASRTEQRYLDKELLQRQAKRLEQASAAPATAAAVALPTPSIPVAAAPQPPGAPAASMQIAAAQPVAIPLPDQAQQAARDPAVAAAIAAYHVNTGPFAVQNLKPDLAPPRARPLAPVAAVTKVEAASATATPGDGSAPLR